MAAREAGGFAGGWVGATAGGQAAGWTASLLCGPGAAVCALVVTVVIVGGAASEYAAPRELVASIAAECRRTTQARDGRPVDITADALLATSPAGVVTFLRDCGLLTFRQDPATYARSILEQPEQ